MAQAGDTDISLIDYLRLIYWRRYTADQNILWLTASSHHQVTIDGFSQPDIRVMDITDPNAVREVKTLIAPQEAGFAVTFTTPQPDTRVLLAFTGDQVQRPATIVANQPSQWRKSGQGADLIIISHRDFLGSLEPLRALRQGQGLAVTVVDVEDIYDEFSYGQQSPYAVKDFLRYVVQQWKPVPRFVLLVGHASYDPKGYLGYGGSDLVPTKLIDTQLMETASDGWFVDLDDDGLADMTVGRLPVRTTQEASDLVAKIVSYETTPSSNSVLLVAGRNDTYNFEGVAMELHSMIPAEASVEAVFAGQMDADSAKRDLLDSLNRGPRLVNYASHGSVDLWGNQLLTAADARGLTNRDRLPFVVMTCLNGYSHDPALESLAEAFLNAPQGGAIGVWASSGSTLPEEQALMNQALYRAIFPTDGLDPTGLTLGEATLRAKIAVSNGDVQRPWMLFGDPTTRLAPTP